MGFGLGLGLGVGVGVGPGLRLRSRLIAKPHMRRTCGCQRVACRAVEADGVVARRRHHTLIAARQQRA